MHHGSSTDNHPTEIATIEFHGAGLTTFMAYGEPHVAMRPIVEGMGLAWQSQIDKLNAQPQKFNCHHIMTVAEDGKTRSMLSMPVRKLNLWLASINPNKIRRPDIRSKVELYQEESAQALFNYWNKGIAVRDDYDGVVTDLGTDVRAIIGGIVKSVLHRELVEVVPALVRSEIAASTMLFRHGRTAGQIWAQCGFPRIKVTSWFSNRLCAMGCQIEGGGRVDVGGRAVKLFDPDKADLWIKNGGRALVEAYIAKRGGQKVLHLVGRALGN